MDIFIIEPPIWQNMMEFLVPIFSDLNAFNAEFVENVESLTVNQVAGLASRDLPFPVNLLSSVSVPEPRIGI